MECWPCRMATPSAQSPSLSGATRRWPKSALGMVDAVYLLGMLATLAAEVGAADAASQWLQESEETYAGDGWDIMRSNCYWHTRAERALKR